MGHASRIALIALFVLATQGCSDQSELPNSGRALSRDLLMHGSDLEQAPRLPEFTRPDDATSARNIFSGRLRLDTDHQSNRFEILLDELGLVDPVRSGINELPPFDFEFVQDGDYLVPLQQGPFASEHNWWEFVLRPGRVWDEETDHGFTRAVIPFALKERREDCVHNGLMSFLFSDNGTVSKVAFQVSSQTCRYLQLEMRGLLNASYNPGIPDGAAGVIAVARGNRESRLPQRPIAQLASDYAGADAAEFGYAGCISASVNATVELSAKIWRRRDAVTDAELMELADMRGVIASVPIVAAAKALTAMRTGQHDWRRMMPPLVELNDTQQQTISVVAEKLGFSSAMVNDD